MEKASDQYKEAILFSGNTREISLGQLPMTLQSEGNLSSGIIICLFALAWGGIPTGILIAGILMGNFTPPLLFTLLFTVIGLSIFIYGLVMIIRREKVVVSSSDVQVSRRSITGSQFWSEPLSAYVGISTHEKHVKTKNSSYTIYYLILTHSDATKNICLFASRKGEGHRARQEDFCRALQLPAVMGRENGEFVTRGIDDLDKSIKELVRDGKLRVDFSPASQVPAGIELKTENGGLTVSWDRKNIKGMTRYLIPLLIVLPVGFIILGFILGGVGIVFAVFGIFIVIPVTAAILLGGLVKEEMIIHPSRVTTRIATARWGHFFEKSVDPAKIEEVRIRQGQMAHDRDLVLVTDEGDYKFGKGLSLESLEWLRQCVIFVISR